MVAGSLLFTSRQTWVSNRQEVSLMEKKELSKNQVAKNSSMAGNEEEMKNLGKQMENNRSGEVLKEEHDRVPDPEQYQDK